MFDAELYIGICNMTSFVPQTSKRRAVETTDITRSFGWDSSEGMKIN